MDLRDRFESRVRDGERDEWRFLEDDEWRRRRRPVDREREREAGERDLDIDRRLLPDDFLRELRCSRPRLRGERERRDDLEARRASSGRGEPLSIRSLVFS